MGDYTKKIIHKCSCFIELLNELGKIDKWRLPSSIIFLILEHDVRLYLSYDIKMTLESHFCHKNNEKRSNLFVSMDTTL